MIMTKIPIIVEVEAVPLSSVLGEAYQKYFFYDGRVYSTRRGRTAKKIGTKTPNGTDVVRFTIQYRDPNYSRRYLSERIQLKLSVIQQKVNDFIEGK